MFLFLLLAFFCLIIIDTAFQTSKQSFRQQSGGVVTHETIPSPLSNDIDELCSTLGEKRLLQELSQHLFKGANPFYTYYEANNTVSIKIGSSISYRFTVKETQGRNLGLYRKRQELLASRKLVESLASTDIHRLAVQSYLSRRLNRDNSPTRLSRSQLFALASSKALVVLIDVENVPDFKSCFFVSRSGEVRFLAPPLPPARIAPSLTDDDDHLLLLPSSLQSEEEDEEVIFADEDTLILTYAHYPGPQAMLANRLTLTRREDAADALMLFDLGALSLLSPLRKVSLSCRCYHFADMLSLSVDSVGDGRSVWPERRSLFHGRRPAHVPRLRSRSSRRLSTATSAEDGCARSLLIQH